MHRYAVLGAVGGLGLLLASTQDAQAKDPMEVLTGFKSSAGVSEFNTEAAEIRQDVEKLISGESAEKYKGDKSTAESLARQRELYRYIQTYVMPKLSDPSFTEPLWKEGVQAAYVDVMVGEGSNRKKSFRVMQVADPKNPVMGADGKPKPINLNKLEGPQSIRFAIDGDDDTLKEIFKASDDTTLSHEEIDQVELAINEALAKKAIDLPPDFKTAELKEKANRAQLFKTDGVMASALKQQMRRLDENSSFSELGRLHANMKKSGQPDSDEFIRNRQQEAEASLKVLEQLKKNPKVLADLSSDEAKCNFVMKTLGSFNNLPQASKEACEAYNPELKKAKEAEVAQNVEKENSALQQQFTQAMSYMSNLAKSCLAAARGQASSQPLPQKTRNMISDPLTHLLRASCPSYQQFFANRGVARIDSGAKFMKSLDGMRGQEDGPTVPDDWGYGSEMPEEDMVRLAKQSIQEFAPSTKKKAADSLTKLNRELDCLATMKRGLAVQINEITMAANANEGLDPQSAASLDKLQNFQNEVGQFLEFVAVEVQAREGGNTQGWAPVGRGRGGASENSSVKVGKKSRGSSAAGKRKVTRRSPGKSAAPEDMDMPPMPEDGIY